MKILKSKVFFIKSFILLVILAVAGIIVSRMFLEPYAYNFMVRNFSANTPGDNNTVIVTIDNKSIEAHRWPWPREYYAKILNYFNEYAKPKVIGLDAIINTPDNENLQSDLIFYEAIKKTPNLVVGFSPVDYQTQDQNEDSKKYNNKFRQKFGLNITSSDGIVMNGSYKEILKFPNDYFEAISKTGSVKMANNQSGYSIYTFQLISVDDIYYPSLALRMYLYLNDTDRLTLMPNYLFVDKTGLKIPTNATSKFAYNLIKYYKKFDNSDFTHKKYSAIEIIDSYDLIKAGKKPIIDPKEFEGKTVFIGGYAKATALALEDKLKTPISDDHPGVDIQATNFDNIMNNDFMRNSQEILHNFPIYILTIILTFIIIKKFSFIGSLMILIAFGISYLLICAYGYKHGLAMRVFTPIVLEFLTTIFGYSYRFILEGKNKEKIKQAMGKYLSQDIMKNVVQNIDDIKLGGKRANVTVLFADIRGFTSMSEKMSAEEVSKILNEYFTEIEPIITKYNGVINKFIGDAVMAIFGEPIPDINHPLNAVKCAYAMLKKVEELQDKWIFEGKPKIEIGIGINTGEAFVGNIGSEKRLEYTVIGDTVNLASRIESYNKVYHTNFLVSSSTYSYITKVADVIKISEVSIRGKSKKMDIYEVLRLSEK